MSGKIFEAIPKIMAEVGVIGKTRTNTQGSGYMFRGIDDVYSALQPLLHKHGVFFVPNVLESVREERQSKSGGNLIYTVLKVKYVFFADDGSTFEAIVSGEAMDSGDKSSNKAMSSALKYVLLQVFCIPTEEENDTEYHSPHVIPKSAPIMTKTSASTIGFPALDNSSRPLNIPVSPAAHLQKQNPAPDVPKYDLKTPGNTDPILIKPVIHQSGSIKTSDASTPTTQNIISDGVYRVDFGQWEGKTLEKILELVGPDVIHERIRYFETSAQEQKRPLSGRALAFVENANKFLDGLLKFPPSDEQDVPFN